MAQLRDRRRNQRSDALNIVWSRDQSATPALLDLTHQLCEAVGAHRHR
jgi:hypothetical protein